MRKLKKYLCYGLSMMLVAFSPVIVPGHEDDRGHVLGAVMQERTMHVTKHKKALEGTPIYTADDLQNLHEQTGSYYLANDIDLHTYGVWKSITGFKGVLDGNGYSIKNLQCTIGSAEDISFSNITKKGYAIGLFGKLKGAVIKNLTLENINFSIKESESEKRIMVGGICGIGAYVTLQNVFVSGKMKIDQTKNNSQYEVGGLAGFLTDTDTNKTNNTIKESGSYVQIDQTAKSNRSWICTGGILGHGLKNVVMNDCYNRGNISFVLESESTAENKPVLYLCGLAGVLYGQMRNCYNTGTISGFNKEKNEAIKTYGTAYFGGTEYFGYNLYILKNTATYTWRRNTSGLEPQNCSFKTEEEMKQQETYQEFDFTTKWDIDPVFNDGYPFISLYEPVVETPAPAASAPPTLSIPLDSPAPVSTPAQPSETAAPATPSSTPKPHAEPLTKSQFQFKKTSVHLKVHKTQTISCKLASSVKWSELTFVSSKKSVATVSKKSKNKIVITGKKAGTVKISCKYKGKTADSKVSVVVKKK